MRRRGAPSAFAPGWHGGVTVTSALRRPCCVYFVPIFDSYVGKPVMWSGPRDAMTRARPRARRRGETNDRVRPRHQAQARMQNGGRL